MLAGSDGNLSARIDEDRVLITRSGVAKGRLGQADFVEVNLEGELISGEGKPSSETAMHLTAYQKRPDVTACLHSHPPYATSFAVAGVELARNILPEVTVFVGDIPLIEYAPPGTGAISKAIEPFLAKNNAFLLRNHGLLTVGRSVDEALFRHETVEHFAKILWRARQLGTVCTIPDDELERLDKIRQGLL
jgi:L-fuculose-phosphate aldolase